MLILFILLTLFTSFTRINAASTYHACAAVTVDSYVDVVIVIEASSTMLDPRTIFDIVSRLENYAYQLRLSDSLTPGHTSRIALITYDDKVKVRHALNDTQIFDSLLTALSALRLLTARNSLGDILTAFKEADKILTDNNSFRAAGILLVATAFDKTKKDAIFEQANLIKEAGTLIAVLPYTDAADNIDFLGSLASPGLIIDKSELNIAQFGQKMALINCRCPSGTTTLTLKTDSDSQTTKECAVVEDTQVLPMFLECPNNGFPFTVETPDRLKVLTDLLQSMNTNINNISLGLMKNESTWYWETPYGNTPYTNYPSWAKMPESTAAYGYLNFENNSWNLYADDGDTNSFPYVCVQKSCDTSTVCDLNN